MWRVVESFSGVDYCLERLVLCKSYRVTDLCHELGCSQRYLHAMFVRDIGVPPKQWMTLERMVVARRKLEEGKTAQEVASELGYLSVVTFNRQFQKCYMMSPARFIKERNDLDTSKVEASDANTR